jgi:hypothetical protein
LKKKENPDSWERERERERKHVSLAQQNGFGKAFFVQNAEPNRRA